jgi:hypothetical protein
MATMLLAVVPKFPIFNGVRLFGINRIKRKKKKEISAILR